MGVRASEWERWQAGWTGLKINRWEQVASRPFRDSSGPAKDMEHTTIGLIGLGTVGTGVARLLTEHADRIARRAGKSIRWKWAVVRDPEKRRDVPLDGVRVTTDASRPIEDPEVDIVVELMGG